MKIALRIFIALLGLISVAVGLMLFVKDGDIAEQVAGLGTFGLLPDEGAFRTGSYVAFLAALVTLALIVLSFTKKAKAILYTAIATIVVLILCYVLQPDFAKGLTGGATSREVAMIQLALGAIAAGLAILLSRKVNS